MELGFSRMAKMRRHLVWLVVVGLLARVPFAADLPSFEVASVKHSDPAGSGKSPNVCTGGPGTSDPGTLHCVNASLSLFILTAYELKWYELIGPDWIIHGGSESGYDITAKIPTGTSKEDYHLMLQRLLAERFHLVVHRETRELQIYALTAGKAKPHLTLSATPPPPGPRCAISFAKNHYEWACHNTPMKDLAGNLETQLWGHVADETGLSGEYDFTFTFIPPETWQARTGWSPSSAVADDTPTLFTAISEQLGLRIEMRKGPVQVLVVDNAAKNPTEN